MPKLTSARQPITSSFSERPHDECTHAPAQLSRTVPNSRAGARVYDGILRYAQASRAVGRYGLPTTTPVHHSHR